MDLHGGRIACDFSSHAMTFATRTPTMAQLSTATTSHGQLDVTGRAGAGIPECPRRVSADLEDVEDLVVDLAAGLAVARSAVPA